MLVITRATGGGPLGYWGVCSPALVYARPSAAGPEPQQRVTPGISPRTWIPRGRESSDLVDATPTLRPDTPVAPNNTGVSVLRVPILHPMKVPSSICFPRYMSLLPYVLTHERQTKYIYRDAGAVPMAVEPGEKLRINKHHRTNE